MRVGRVLIALLSAFLSIGSIASSIGQNSEPQNSTHIITLSAGPAWVTRGTDQAFFLQPEIEKTYTAGKNTNALLSTEFFYGWQHRLNSIFLGHIGFALAATSDARLSGEIWDDADPLFNDLIYKYKVNHMHVAAKGKLLADMKYSLKPYVSASLGVGFNHAHGFNNTPIIFEAIQNPDFSEHTQTSFTYTLGIGLQRNISQNWEVGMGYELADWGKSQLGRSPSQTLGNGLSQSHVYTNGLLFSLTYSA